MLKKTCLSTARTLRVFFPVFSLAAFLFVLNGCGGSASQQPKEDPLQKKTKTILDEDPQPPFKYDADKDSDAVKSIDDHSLNEKERNPFNLGAKKAEQEKKTEKPFYEKYIPADDKPSKVSLTFDATPIPDIVPVFAQFLNFNYLIDPQVKGAVTMTLSSEVTKKQLWEIFQQILWLNGSYCSPDDDIIHVQPFSKMPQERRLLTNHVPQANVDVVFVPVRNAASKDILEYIKPFLSEGATAMDIPFQNSLLLVETPENVPKLKELINILDHKNKSGWPQIVMRCVNVSSDRIRDELAALLPVLGFPVTVGDATLEPGSLQIVSLPRFQILVAAAANQEALDEMKTWVTILDRTDVGEQERVFIYKVVNSKADELEQALSVIFNVESSTLQAQTTSGSSSSGSSGRNSNSRSGSSSRSSSSASSARNSSSQQRAQTSTPAQQNRPQQQGGGRQVAKASGADDSPASVFDVPVKLFADAVNNRLVIRTVPKSYSMIKAVLERLDTIASQVLLQVMVAEVTLDSTTNFGIEFSKANKIGGADNLYGTNYNALHPGAPNDGKDQGFKYYLSDPDNPDQKFAYLNALAGDNKLKVLSSPQILVVSHTEAKISVGDRVPIVTNEITDTSSTTNNSTTLNRSIQYEDTGVILVITPHVTRGGLITVEMEQTVSDAVKNTTSGIDSPVIQERILKTSLAFRDGRTIIVGGLIRERALDNLESVPLVNTVSYLNRLLGKTTAEYKRTELLVLITGRIINESSKLEDMIERYKTAVESIRSQGIRDRDTQPK